MYFMWPESTQIKMVWIYLLIQSSIRGLILSKRKKIAPHLEENVVP